MVAIFVLAVYSIAWAIAWFFLARWLHANRHEELGKSLTAELIYSFMLAFVWPASISLMLLNDTCSMPDKDDDDF